MKNKERPEFVRESPDYEPRWYEKNPLGAYALAALAAGAITFGPIIIRDWIVPAKKVERRNGN